MSAHPRLAVWSGRLLLAALFLDLAGTKWASYLPTPLPGLYLPDALLAAAAVLAGLALSAGFRVASLGTSLGLSVGCIAYIAYRLIGAPSIPPPGAFLWLRDMAPFLYVALIPLLVGAAQTVSFAALLRTVRLATAVMALTVTGHLMGILEPIDIGTDLPLFSTRPDVDNVVLGIGILAFGRWGSVGRPHRIVQVTLLVLAAANYSRAGLLAALLCLVVAALRERRALISAWVLAPTLVVSGLAGMLLLLVPPSMSTNDPLSAPDAVARLIESDVSQGTTRARVRAWTVLLDHTQRRGDLLTGSGPGTQPLMDSGAVVFLSGAEEVRAPHNWFVGSLAYHGIVGLLVWTIAFVRLLKPRNLRGEQLLATAGIAAYLSAGLFGVVIESPFGSLPIVSMLAWVLAHEPRPGKTMEGHQGTEAAMAAR